MITCLCTAISRDTVSGPKISLINHRTGHYICTALCSNMQAETRIHSQLRNLALPLASSTPHLLTNFQTKHSFIIITQKALKLMSTLLGRKRNKNGRMTLKLKTRSFQFDIKTENKGFIVNFSV